MNKLFFELIRVAIGNAICLSHTPNADEWGELYAMAKKQSLVGVCFAGVQRLQKQRQCPPEELYLQWMGMAAKIQQRNEVVNRQCAELGERLRANGYRYAILKGQGIASFYNSFHSNLSLLRQSGDIDVYVCGGMKSVLEWCKKHETVTDYDYVHTALNVFKDTEVEVHYRYGCLYNFTHNNRLQAWFESNQSFVDLELPNGVGKISVPSNEFNVVYLLHHIYRHLFVEGVGLRQVMDYYFVLRTQMSDSRLRINDDLHRTLDNLGMLKFASALMWVQKEVFGLEDEYMMCEPNKQEGRYLLDCIMSTGNFGHNRKKDASEGICAKWLNIAWHSLSLVWHYPSEALCAPIWHVYHFIWKRTKGRI